MKFLIFSRARDRSVFRFASMHIPEKNTETRSQTTSTSILGFSEAMFAFKVLEFRAAVDDYFTCFRRQALELTHGAHRKASPLIERALNAITDVAGVTVGYFT